MQFLEAEACCNKPGFLMTPGAHQSAALFRRKRESHPPQSASLPKFLAFPENCERAVFVATQALNASLCYVGNDDGVGMTAFAYAAHGLLDVHDRSVDLVEFVSDAGEHCVQHARLTAVSLQFALDELESQLARKPCFEKAAALHM